MGTLTHGPIDRLLDKIAALGVEGFIETGTHRGDGTLHASKKFPVVLTIEHNRELAEAARERLLETPAVVVTGNSPDYLQLWMPTAIKPVCLWLDAHDVAGQFGDKDACPLMEELAAIAKSPVKHFILIDDAHCFKPNKPTHLTPEAWPIIEQIEAWANDNDYIMVDAHDCIVMADPKHLPLLSAFTNDEVQNTGAMGLAKLILQPRPNVKITARGVAFNGPTMQGAIPSTLPGFTGMAYTQYGWMLVHRHDTNQTPALLSAGVSANYPDIDLLARYVRRRGDFGAVFLDIGANFGAYAFGLRPYCKEVHAWEAQRIIFNMLAGSIALNAWTNVYAYHKAVGGLTDTVIYIPQFDYNKPMSFGSVEFGLEQREPLHQKRLSDKKSDLVECTTIDDYDFPRVDVMKIDVEGMEEKVLNGATHTIMRTRPVMFVEYLKSDKAYLKGMIEDSFDYVTVDCGNDFLCFPQEEAEACLKLYERPMQEVYAETRRQARKG